MLVFGSLLLFVPFHRSGHRVASAGYLAFIAVCALFPAGGLPAAQAVRDYLFGALSLGGIALIMAGWARIYRLTGGADGPPAELIEDGIYGVIRHPQYLGFLAVSLSVLVRTPGFPGGVMWVLHAALLVGQARREERALELCFGPRWRAYRARVGMFMPRLSL
jgi:protein-S-isoprenylcysteine O-methyltransferase Ste14